MSIACDVTDSVGSGPAPSPSLNSAVNHPRFRVMNLNGVQVECEVHFPRELTGSPACPGSVRRGSCRRLSCRPSSLVGSSGSASHPFPPPSPSSAAALCTLPGMTPSASLGPCSSDASGHHSCLCPGTFARAVHLTREASHPGSASPGELFCPPTSGQLLPHPSHHCRRPGTSSRLGRLSHALHPRSRHIWGRWTPLF